MRWVCPICGYPTLIGWESETMEGCQCEKCGYSEGPFPKSY
jgi:Zn ribbon nucleic-acid-binding protein